MTDHATLRILIVRLSAIGDCIVTTPVLNALRDTFPGAFIAWATDRPPAKLLRGHRGLDQLIEVPRRWLKQPGAYLQIRKELQKYNFDVALDPQSLSKSSLLAWLSGASKRIGFAKPTGRELAPWMNTVRITPTKTHIAEQQLELLQALDVNEANVRFDLPGDPESQSTVDDWLHKTISGQSPVVINPGASWQSKVWEMDRYAGVADHLYRRFGLRTVVLWGSDDERKMAQQILDNASTDVTLAPPTTLPEMACLLRRAHMYIGSDTGPTHAASALGVPCVCICGTTRGEYSGPYGPQHQILQAYFQSGTSRERRRAGNTSMQEITAQMVMDACQKILQDLPDRATDGENRLRTA